MQPTTVLIVDDEPALRSALRRLLAPEGYRVLEAPDGAVAMQMLASVEADPTDERPRVDIILSDVRMPNAGGMEVLRYVKEHAPDSEILLLTAFGQVSDAVAALRLGAFNFIEKPFDPESLRQEVRRAERVVAARRAARSEPTLAPAPAQGSLLGSSPAMRQLRALVSRIGPSESTALIVGESGTGKELVARALHEASPRAKAPFVAVHCGAIPESLFESELFGHVKGAFTGAHAAREGRFAQAEGGTIFLDEIGEMPLPMQVRLLRVLQERTYDPVGASRPRRGDFRVIAATHRDLSRLCAEGKFREDLYFRLNVVPLPVAPLRERSDDVVELCEAFLLRQNQRRGTSLQPPDPECAELLRRYSWPGNVRELEHLVERAAVLKGEGALTAADLPPVMRGGARPATAPERRTSAGAIDLRAELQRIERDLIRGALAETGGNRHRAAQLLGLNRTTLVEKLKRLGLATPAESDEDASA